MLTTTHFLLWLLASAALTAAITTLVALILRHVVGIDWRREQATNADLVRWVGVAIVPTITLTISLALGLILVFDIHFIVALFMASAVSIGICYPLSWVLGLA